MDQMSIVGQLNYRGDIRETMEPAVMSTPRGPVLPAAVEYDEKTDLTSVYYVPLLDGLSAVAAEDNAPSLLDAARALRS